MHVRGQEIVYWSGILVRFGDIFWGGSNRILAFPPYAKSPFQWLRNSGEFMGLIMKYYIGLRRRSHYSRTNIVEIDNCSKHLPVSAEGVSCSIR